ncbi:MAG TPA: molybdate ABC transporter permease subunit [Candidatus Polarisedimenticolia bacterium]|nr:molybdate ABC transporter permease subunit [Candidatus Polarisedimenticolia bacterium]
MTPSDFQVVWFTLWASALSTMLIFPLGIAAAWALARWDFHGKSIFETILALPLVMPPVATGLILLRILGRRGILGRFLDEALGLEIAFTWRAVVVATGVMSFPLLVRSARVAFQEVNPRLEQIARTLGANDLKVFRSITVPLALRGILSGVVLAFARALGEFGATILVAGNIPGKTATLSLSIYQAVQLGQDATAYRLLGISTAIAFAAVWSSEFIQRARRRPS